jgi:hypothetical protein
MHVDARIENRIEELAPTAKNQRRTSMSAIYSTNASAGCAMEHTPPIGKPLSLREDATTLKDGDRQPTIESGTGKKPRPAVARRCSAVSAFLGSPAELVLTATSSSDLPAISNQVLVLNDPRGQRGDRITDYRVAWHPL